jgi:hypothetical protein
VNEEPQMVDGMMQCHAASNAAAGHCWPRFPLIDVLGEDGLFAQ